MRTTPRICADILRAYLLSVAVCLLLSAATGCQMSATGHNVDGVRYFQQGQHQQAIQEFQQALAVNPDNADGYYNLAATLHESGRKTQDAAKLQQAEGYYHQCLDLSPDHVDCHRGLAVLLIDTNRPQKAFTLYERWAERSPQIADSRIELARLYHEFGDENAARRYLTEALDADASNPRAWAALGRLRELEGQYAQALANYEHSYSLNNMQPAIAERIAALQRQTNQASNPAPITPSTPRTVSNPSNWMPR